MEDPSQALSSLPRHPSRLRGGKALPEREHVGRQVSFARCLSREQPDEHGGFGLLPLVRGAVGLARPLHPCHQETSAYTATFLIQWRTRNISAAEEKSQVMSLFQSDDFVKFLRATYPSICSVQATTYTPLPCGTRAPRRPTPTSATTRTLTVSSTPLLHR